METLTKHYEQTYAIVSLSNFTVMHNIITSNNLIF